MTRPRKLIFLLADGAHARFVERSPDNGAYVTVRRMDGKERLEELRAEQRKNPPGRTFESMSAARHDVGPEDPYRAVKEAFVTDVAKALNQMLARGGWDGVVLVAPARLRKTLRAALTPHAGIVHEMAKDLTNTPDHELGDWLSPVALGWAR